MCPKALSTEPLPYLKKQVGNGKYTHSNGSDNVDGHT